MKQLWGVLFATVFSFAGIGVCAAQQPASGVEAPPKILVILREYLKPGRAGAVHERTESAFVQALTRAKWPTHYFAADSLSGRPRSLFFTAYGSFADWEKDHEMMMKNPALSRELDRDDLADGDLLSASDQAVLSFDEEQSLNASVDIARMRGFEITVFRVRIGHRQEWNELVKLVTAAYAKIPDMHWAMYQLLYGESEGPTYVVFSPFKSGADLDKESGQDKQFMDALGQDGMKKLTELETAAIESTQTNLFVFNPAMSYPQEQWVKENPEFWKLKAEKPATNKKRAETPAAK